MHTTNLPHVLVVCEDAEATSSICSSLAAGAFRCTLTVGTQEAFAVARETPIDVALLDVSDLRPQDRLRLARRWRDEGSDPGVVMIARSRSLEDLLDALRLGVVDYLAKPFGKAELADAVTRAVEWRIATCSVREQLLDWEEEMARNAVRVGSELASAGIRSSAELDARLERLYERSRPALEHARRVVSAAKSIAVRIDVAEPLLGHIERAALLHDIGKLGVPRSILQRAWPLTAAEQAIIRSHVTVAAQALSRVPFLEPTAVIVGATREHYDGSGYPYGRRGGAIPLGARIIAIAEAFDTLGGAYLETELGAGDVANAKLVRGAGSRFDPALVNAWLQCMDDYRL